MWDYDIPCAPILVDVTVDGRPIKAVAQPTKQGFVFVFDRQSGKPVWPIEERPVEQSTVPGERTSPINRENGSNQRKIHATSTLLNAAIKDPMDSITKCR